MTKKFNQYLGKAGHLKIMSEFLLRGWNVAIPEVDIGDDIFVVQDNNGTLRRVQVKTSNATVRRSSITGQFQITLKNLRNITNIIVHYIFIVRRKDNWSEPIIIKQDQLLDYIQNTGIGSKFKDNVNLYLNFSDNKVECSGQDFTKHINDYTDFPIIQH